MHIYLYINQSRIFNSKLFIELNVFSHAYLMRDPGINVPEIYIYPEKFFKSEKLFQIRKCFSNSENIFQIRKTFSNP